GAVADRGWQATACRSATTGRRWPFERPGAKVQDSMPEPLRPIQWQREANRGPLPELALRENTAAVEEHELLGDREAEPRPARVLRLVEAGEDVRQVLGRDASPAVGNGDPHLARLRRLRGPLAPDPDAASARRVLQRISHQVGDNLPDADGIDVEGGKVGGALDRQGETRRLGLSLKRRDDILE